MERSVPQAIERVRATLEARRPPADGRPHRPVRRHGYTGRLTAEAMVARGLQPRAGRAQPAQVRRARRRPRAASRPLGPTWPTPPSVTALVEEGDVLVSTVGPIRALGRPGCRGSLDRGRSLPRLDGRAALHPRGLRALRAGGREDRQCGMLTAFGYDWVPGNLAGGLALDARGTPPRASTSATSSPAATSSMSGGTKASLVGVIAAPPSLRRRARADRARAPGACAPSRSPLEGARRRVGRELGALRAPAAGAAAARGQRLPRLVRTGLASDAGHVGRHEPRDEGAGRGGLWKAAGERVVKGSTGGPDASTRAKSGSHIVAIAYDEAANP